MTAAAPRTAGTGDASLAAALLAVDPAGLCGIWLRAGAGPVREGWLSGLVSHWPAAAPVRRMPAAVDDEALLGGLDVAGSLGAGRPVSRQGLLAGADGGLVVIPMAERLGAGTAARLAAALDGGSVPTAVTAGGRERTRFAVVACDESADAEDTVPAALADRLAFRIDLDALALERAAAMMGGQSGAAEPAFGPAAVDAARRLLPGLALARQDVEALCGCAEALGVASPRAVLLAARAAVSRAALRAGTAVTGADIEDAVRLVLLPRATCLPASAEPGPPAPETPEPTQTDPAPGEASAADGPLEHAGGETPAGEPAGEPGRLAEQLVAGALASLPPSLLADLMARVARGVIRSGSAGKAGAALKGGSRGRAVGTRAGLPRGSQRLDIVASLRAGLPWQGLRRRALPAGHPLAERPVLLRRDDLRIRRIESRSASVIVFAVDASGSQALHRLGEAKGAVELLLAECYARRDEVALVAFRGRGAELLLPPTRSLARAKRSLAGLPGGGGTPLAAGIEAAGAVAETARRRGRTPLLVVLTDGRANVARDGTGGRPQASADALAAARRLRGLGLPALVIDTSPHPQPPARTLAEALDAPYLPLPHADATALTRAVRLAAPAA